MCKQKTNLNVEMSQMYRVYAPLIKTVVFVNPRMTLWQQFFLLNMLVKYSDIASKDKTPKKLILLTRQQAAPQDNMMPSRSCHSCTYPNHSNFPSKGNL